MKQRVKETLLSQFDPSFASFAICQWHGYSHIFCLMNLKPNQMIVNQRKCP